MQAPVRCWVLLKKTYLERLEKKAKHDMVKKPVKINKINKYKTIKLYQNFLQKLAVVKNAMKTK